MTRTQGRGSGQWWGDSELYLTSSLTLLCKAALPQCPYPGRVVLVAAITILDPSDSAALIPGTASLAPLTLRSPLLPSAWALRPGQMLELRSHPHQEGRSAGIPGPQSIPVAAGPSDCLLCRLLL